MSSKSKPRHLFLLIGTVFIILYLSHVYYLVLTIQRCGDISAAILQHQHSDQMRVERSWTDLSKTTWDLTSTTSPHCRYVSFLSGEEVAMVDFINNCVTKISVDGRMDWSEVACEDKVENMFFHGNSSDVYLDLKDSESFVVFSQDNGLYICAKHSESQDQEDFSYH